MIALLVHGPIPQDPAYHDFADKRSYFGVPNFFDVMSNVPFVLVGIAGLAALRKPRPFPELRAIYATLFAGLILVAFGSAYYHLHPDNFTLVFDRLPMTIVFMAFVAAMIGERVDVRLARRTLPILLVTGFASVIYWYFTNDLRLYALVQYLPVVLLPVMLPLYPRPFERDRYLPAIFMLYALAKVFELFDKPIYRTLRVVSGHTLKHLAAAAALYAFVLAMRHRRLRDAAYS